MIKQAVLLLLSFYSNYLSFDRGILRIFAFGGACKYQPTCSQYTILQVNRFGVIKGLCMGVRRFLSCI